MEGSREAMKTINLFFAWMREERVGHSACVVDVEGGM